MTNTPITGKTILYMQGGIYFESMRDLDTLSAELKKAKDSDAQEKLLKCPCILTLKTAQGNTRNVMNYFVDVSLIMAIIDTETVLNDEYFPMEDATAEKEKIVEELKK